MLLLDNDKYKFSFNKFNNSELVLEKETENSLLNYLSNQDLILIKLKLMILSTTLEFIKMIISTRFSLEVILQKLVYLEN